jgi:antitoxin MazE
MVLKLRKIGNSAGILLSKTLIEQCSIKDEVSVTVKNGSIIITPVKKKPRDGWEEQFIKAGSQNDNEKLMGDIKNKFDEEEWTW